MEKEDLGVKIGLEIHSQPFSLEKKSVDGKEKEY